MICAKLGADTDKYSLNKESELIDLTYLIDATTTLTSEIPGIGQIYKNRNDRSPIPVLGPWVSRTQVPA
jgi:hypothetical protein